MDYLIRPADAADLPMIYRGERDYMREQEPDGAAGWVEATDRNLALWIANLDRAFVLDADGVPAGYAIWMADTDRAVLITVRIGSEHRRHGLGRRLLQAYVDDARVHGFERLELGVHKANPAKALYESFGFTHARDDDDYAIYALTPAGRATPASRATPAGAASPPDE